jgi:hypothetical protein
MGWMGMGSQSKEGSEGVEEGEKEKMWSGLMCGGQV